MRTRTQKQRRWRAVLLTLAMLLGTIGFTAFGPAGKASADPDCMTSGGVYVVWARGSGEHLNDQEAHSFYQSIPAALPAGTPWAWSELGNEDGRPQVDMGHDPTTYGTSAPYPDASDEYPAVPIGDGNFVNVFNGKYHDSVWVGARELIAHLNNRVLRCPQESIVIGGFSQGADVVGSALQLSGYGALNATTRSHIGFVALYGDPTFDPGPLDDRMNKVNFSSHWWWVRGNGPGYRVQWGMLPVSSSGVYGPRNPYVPWDFGGRYGSWCDAGDGFCTGTWMGTWDSGTHGDAYHPNNNPVVNKPGGWIADSTCEVAYKAMQMFHQLNPSSTLPTSTCTPQLPDPNSGPVVVPPTSPPLPPGGASPIENGGFNADTSHWGVTGTANLTRYTAASGQGTNPYEGSGYAATNASQSGDSIAETNVASIHAGDTYCASAQVVTVGNATGGSGILALWLTGGTTNNVSTKEFSSLPGNSNWKPQETCVTATTNQSYVKVQIYPSVGSPTIGVDAVDVHQTLSANGGFDGGNSYWNTQPGTNFTTYTAADNTGTNPYEGTRFGATNTATAQGSIYQDLPRSIGVGDTFCASAQVVTVGGITGGAGALYVYLTGGSGTEESHFSFSGLPGNNGWTPVKTCVTATSAHSNIRVQVYPAVGVPTIGVDALDVHSSIIQNGGLNGDSSHWGASGGLSYMNWGNYNGTLPYEGSGFESIQASSSNDSLYEVRGWQIGVGDTFCASAQVITPGQGSGGGSGTLAIWLLGANGSENSTYSFSGLPAQNNWTPIKTCVTASIAEPYGVIKAQFYPTPGGPPVAVDAVDVH